MDFSTLKRSSDTSLDNIKKQVEKMGQTTFEKDNRFWFPQLDKSGNGSALIRFLPPPPDEEEAFVRFWYHSFKNASTGLTYFENCLTSIGQDDPVVEFNSRLYKTSNDKDSPARKQVSAQKRKLTYVSNVYVIKDPAVPDNDGKVFLHKYGAVIYDKINTMLNPPQDGLGDRPPVNPFDLWKGANFRISLYRGDGGYLKYDRCAFDLAAPLSDDDAKLEKIWRSEYALKPLVDPSNFKSYDELKKRLDTVLGLTGFASASKPQLPEAPRAAEYTPPPSVTQGPVAPTEQAGPPDEDIEAFFANLGKK